MARENASSRPRGRPPVFSEGALSRAADFSYAREVATRRGAQDLVYRMFAVAVLDHYREAFPERAHELDWFFVPRRRHTILSELGRIARPRSSAGGELSWDDRDVARMVEAAHEVAAEKPSAKAGVAMLRRFRSRARRPRVF